MRLPAPRGAGIAAAVTAATALVAVLVWRRTGAAVDVSWIPSWDVRLVFALDGLAVLYAVLAAGVGLLVFVFAASYLPRHLQRDGRSPAEAWRFHGLMVLFLAAMVGLATAGDLILLFVFWDVTAIASYLLIGFDRERADARSSALMALLVTAVSAVLLLVGFLLLRSSYGTTSISEILARSEGSSSDALAGSLVAVAALAKSAQVPLHFWLPRAMAAPTPVSAYLHSAAMVAAGVFLLSRLHPLLARTDALLDGLLAIGLLSMAVGGVLAFAATEFKQLLAYSTISQYGYVVTMLGVGGAAGAAAACLYVLVHGLAKSALFMTSGAVTEATGAKALREVGGLGRTMPALALGSGLAAAGLAALPLTAGFFKDELFFKGALERGGWLPVVAVAGAALTFAYIGRFWAGIFLGNVRQSVESVPAALVAPVVVLGLLVAVGGVFVAPFSGLAEAAARVTHAGPVELDAAYHPDARGENVMALATYAGGGLLLWLRVHFGQWAVAAAELGRRFGPERAYRAALAGLNRLSNAIHDLEVRDLRGRVVAVLMPAGVLVVAGVIVTPTAGTYRVGDVAGGDVALIAALVVCSLAAIAATLPRRHLAMVLCLSAVGFSLAVAYELLGAPDVALVAVLIETIFALLFLGVFALLPRGVLRREAALPVSRTRRVRDPLVGVLSGIVALLVVWGALSRPTPSEGMAERHLEAAPVAHGDDVVTVILADLRALDTLVEVTVLLVAMLGVAAMLRRGRLW